MAGLAGVLVLSGYNMSDGKDDKCGTCCWVNSCCTKISTQPAEISTAALKTLLDSKVPIALFDARTGKYDDGKRIPGAGSLSPEANAEQVDKVIKDKNMLVVTYCANLKCPASSHLAAHLKELGYKNVLEYKPGIAGWIEAGYQVENAVKH